MPTWTVPLVPTGEGHRARDGPFHRLLSTRPERAAFHGPVCPVSSAPVAGACPPVLAHPAISSTASRHTHIRRWFMFPRPDNWPLDAFRGRVVPGHIREPPVPSAPDRSVGVRKTGPRTMEIVQSAHLGAGIPGQLGDALFSAAALVHRVPQRSLGQATPCPGWSVRDVVDHLAAVAEKFGSASLPGRPGPSASCPANWSGRSPRRSSGTSLRLLRAPGASIPRRSRPPVVLPFGSFEMARRRRGSTCSTR